VEEGKPERGSDLGCAQVAVDSGQDRVEPAELTLRVQAENCVGERLRARATDGEAPAQLLAHRRVDGERAREVDVCRLGRRLAQLVAPSAAIQAGGATEGTPDGDGIAAAGRRLPDELLGGECPPAGWAQGRESLRDPGAEAGGPKRR